MNKLKQQSRSKSRSSAVTANAVNLKGNDLRLAKQLEK